MPIVVQKYGGSSVADVQKMQKVADRVASTKATGKDVVVVVSAMGDTTDDLLALAKQVCESPARRELDMLLSAGERISMALLSMALNARGMPAVSFTGSQSGIVTNDAHTNARIVEVRPFRVQDELAQGKVVIVAGYQGVSYRRDITTLGRGGSDTTAVALAAALEADCEIYSDVEGVYTADPRVVPEARRLAELSYEEMQELAESGAQVPASLARPRRGRGQRDRPHRAHHRGRRARSPLPRARAPRRTSGGGEAAPLPGLARPRWIGLARSLHREPPRLPRPAPLSRGRGLLQRHIRPDPAAPQ